MGLPIPRPRDSSRVSVRRPAMPVATMRLQTNPPMEANIQLGMPQPCSIARRHHQSTRSKASKVK
eukprot:3591019-Prorocentrum_lima.AAC.1